MLCLYHTIITKKKTNNRKIGRPSKLMLAARKAVVEKKAMAVTSAATKLNEARNNNDSHRLCKGTLKNIVHEVETDFSLDPGTIKHKTVSKRAECQSSTGMNNMSPLAEIEPLIVQFCIAMARLGEPLTRTTVVALANDIIADNDHVKSKLLSHRKTCKSDVGPKVGNKWNKNFMKRQSDKIAARAVLVKDKKRATWVKEENFKAMYDCIYGAMVDSKIALIQDGKFSLTRPEYLVLVDETGCNTNQLKDGLVGGELFVVPNDEPEAGPRGVTNDMHHTVLGFMLGTGEPLMCAVIFKTEKQVSEIPLNWKLGINQSLITAGCPKFVNGKTVPCFYGASPNASITSDMLVEMLKQIEESVEFNRSDATPFLLLDGHQSRVMMPFLKYVNNEATKWTAAIGVPYATHLWQVADASELNGSFKMSLAKAKREYIANNQLESISATDIIPLVSTAWENSFNKKEQAVKAISDRGWNPLNYALLEKFKKEEEKSINLESGSSFTMLNKLIEQRKRDEGKRRQLEAQAACHQNKRSRVEFLKD